MLIISKQEHNIIKCNWFFQADIFRSNSDGMNWNMQKFAHEIFVTYTNILRKEKWIYIIF